MITTTAPLLLLILAWPLLLALAVAFRASRGLAMRAVPWAALSALLAAGVLGDAGLQLPHVMLGGMLLLDGSARLLLLLNGALWLAAGLLAQPQLHAAGGGRFGVLLLLAMAGAQGLALAGDALLFFAAGTLAGYALYGLLIHQAHVSTQRAGRALLVLLVVSDLVVFELLLLLGQAAGGVDFAALRAALIDSDSRGLLLGLLLVGFGVKAGVIGLHVWLAPALSTAAPAVRPALIGFMFGAGLLGWLRLLPLGQAQWVEAAQVLQFLAWATLLYAVVVGCLQMYSRAVLGYAAMALSGLWLALLGQVLGHPHAWPGLAEAGPAALLQSGFALAALLVVPQSRGSYARAGWRPLGRVVMWLAALLLAMTPLGFMVAVVDDGTRLAMFAFVAGMALLTVRAVMLMTATSRRDPDGMVSGQRFAHTASAIPLWLACGLAGAALLIAAASLHGLSLAEWWRAALLTALAAGAAWWSVRRRPRWLPVLSAGDLLAPVSRGLAAALRLGRGLGHSRLPRWRDAALARLLGPCSRLDWRLLAGHWEAAISRWSTAVVLLVLLGLLAAGLSARS